jgi:hypothetical protein
MGFTKKEIPLTQKTYTNCLGIYYRAMETEDFVYFVNFHEGDENGAVIMYRKEESQLSLVSDNYFAYVGLDEDLVEGNQTWMSKRMEKNWKLYLEEMKKEGVERYLNL